MAGHGRWCAWALVARPRPFFLLVHPVHWQRASPLAGFVAGALTGFVAAVSWWRSSAVSAATAPATSLETGCSLAHCTDSGVQRCTAVHTVTVSRRNRWLPRSKSARFLLFLPISWLALCRPQLSAAVTAAPVSCHALVLVLVRASVSVILVYCSCCVLLACLLAGALLFFSLSLPTTSPTSPHAPGRLLSSFVPPKTLHHHHTSTPLEPLVFLPFSSLVFPLFLITSIRHSTFFSFLFLFTRFIRLVASLPVYLTTSPYCKGRLSASLIALCP